MTRKNTLLFQRFFKWSIIISSIFNGLSKLKRLSWWLFGCFIVYASQLSQQVGRICMKDESYPDSFFFFASITKKVSQLSLMQTDFFKPHKNLHIFLSILGDWFPGPTNIFYNSRSKITTWPQLLFKTLKYDPSRPLVRLLNTKSHFNYSFQ